MNNSEWNDELEPEAKKFTKAEKPDVRFGLTQMRPTSPFRGRLLVKRSILEQLRMSNWRVNIRTGKAMMKHRIAIVPDPAGKFEFQQVGKNKGGDFFRLILPPIPDWPEFKIDIDEASFEIGTAFGTRKALFVDLPESIWSQPHRQKAAARFAEQKRMRT